MVKEKAPAIAPVEQTLPSKCIYIVYNGKQKTKYSASLSQHMEDWVEPEGLSLPVPSQFPNKDLRYFDSGEQWRDTQRRHLNMQALKIKFFSIFLELHEEDAEVTKIPIFGPIDAKPLWSEFQNILLQNDREIRFLYTIRPLEPDEDFEPECDGVPILMEADSRMGEDGDIERVIARQPGTGQIEDAVEVIENLAILSGGGTAIKRRPIS